MSKKKSLKHILVFIFALVLLSGFFVKSFHHHHDFAYHPGCMLCFVSQTPVEINDIDLHIAPVFREILLTVESTFVYFIRSDNKIFRISPSNSPPFV